MTDNTINDYLYNKLNYLGADNFTIDELNKFTLEFWQELRKEPLLKIMAIKIAEIRDSYKKYTSSSLREKIHFNPTELYKQEIIVIIVEFL